MGLENLTISIGSSRTTLKWKPKDIAWDQLLNQISTTIRTKETLEEYKSMTKNEQSEVKDVGGFVGGTLKGGKRGKGHVAWRSLITLDVDHADSSFWPKIEMLFGYKCALYSTHSHTKDSPRYRLVIPLKSPIKSELYQPVSRMLAKQIELEAFDHTTYQPHRLMYWPSTPADGEFVFKSKGGDLVDAQDVLAIYKKQGKNWQDPFHWPRHEKEKSDINNAVSRVEDPLEKKGIIGAFNRCYRIPEAIEEFIPEAYKEAGPGRYTYAEGSTYGGLVLYNEDTLAYSHHESDPIGSHVANAFDIVRIHKFGHLDSGDEKSMAKCQSYKKMKEFATNLKPVSKELGIMQLEEVNSLFEDLDNADNEWLGELKRNKNTGQLIQSIENALLILRNDASLKNSIGLNEFSGRPSKIDDLPWAEITEDDNENNWSDADTSYLYAYMEGYGMKSTARINAALDIIMQENSIHPIRKYLKNLEWDGKERLHRLFIDYLGAENNEYVKEVTKKSFTACVKRVMRPGCKMDNLIVLVGAQGTGKSTLLDKMGRQWFSDTLDDMKGKDAYGQISGAWIIELAELAATRKSDIESVKHFVSKRRDDYRKPYDRYESSIPRQCVFFGTTNDYDFLNDPTGNRRFWPVACGLQAVTKDIWSDLDGEIDQLWAEAYKLYIDGYPIHLSATITKLATKIQKEHTEIDPLASEIERYLEARYPENWYDRTPQARMLYVSEDFVGDNSENETLELHSVHAQMIWNEVLGKSVADTTRWDSRRVNNILTSLDGWERSRVTIKGYGRQRGFKRKED